MQFWVPRFDSRLLKNSIYNLVGNAVPLIVAIVTIPFVLRGLGTEQFGLLSLAWMVVGYFSLFDMGIGRAVTKFIAEHYSRGEDQEVVPLFWSAIALQISLGVIGALILAAITPLLVTSVLSIPSDLQVDARASFYVMALSLPFVIGTAGVRGALEAKQEFWVVNAIKIPASSAVYALPLLVLLFSQHVSIVIGVLALSRIVAFFIYFHSCWKSVLLKNKRPYLDRSSVTRLLRYGSWLTVSNIVGPVMVYMDRFLIASLLTLSAVTFYVTPFELITRLLILSSSITGVLFPVFAGYSDSRRVELIRLHNRAARMLAIILIPLTVAVVSTARPLLGFWVGSEFAENSTAVLQILAVGVCINSIAQIPITAIQAIGRADLAARLHLIELLPYAIVLWLFTLWLGIVGTALAWLIRVGVDCVFLFWINSRMLIQSFPIKGGFQFASSRIGDELK